MRKFLLSTLLVMCVGLLFTACEKPMTEEDVLANAEVEEIVSTEQEVAEQKVVSLEEKVLKEEDYQTYSATILLAVHTPMGVQENSARVNRKEGKVLYEFLEIPQMNPNMKIMKILSVDEKIYAQYEINNELVWGYEEGLDFPMQDLFDLKKTSEMFLNEIDPADTQIETVRGQEVQCVAQEEGGLKMKTCFLNGILFDGSSEDTETGMTMTLHVEGFTTEVSDDVFQVPEKTYSIKELNELFQI